MKDPLAELDSGLHAILIGREVVRVGFREWAEWMHEHKYKPRAENDRDNPLDLTRVGFTEVDGAQISTVFLGMDHSFGFGGPGVWFETMIFGGDHDQFQDRYATWAEAAAGHDQVVSALREGRSPDREEEPA